MRIELNAHPVHTGSELYQVSFVIKEQDDLYDVKGQFVQFEIRPEFVHLVWERFRQGDVIGPWRRVTFSPRGPFSCISGHRVLKDGGTSNVVKSYVEVFGSSNVSGQLTNYASGLPGMVELVERAEKRLPV